MGGSSRILTNSGFSGGEVVGYLGNGGTVTINNVQSNGGNHWVALYFANGDSSYRNVTVRSVSALCRLFVAFSDRLLFCFCPR